MRFTYGSTRWVILTERYAIKVARFRPLRPFIRFIDAIRKKEVVQSLNKHHVNIFLATIKYLCAGMVANRCEYRLYKKLHENVQLAPTLFTFLWVVNVQIRGSPATESDVRKSKLLPALINTCFADEILCCEQFCVINGEVCLADYGIEGIEQIIALSNSRR